MQRRRGTTRQPLETSWGNQPQGQDLLRFPSPKAITQANWSEGDTPLRANRSAPSLHSHYSNFITTTGESAPESYIGISASWCNTCAFSLIIMIQVLQFRNESLIESDASCTPDTT